MSAVEKQKVNNTEKQNKKKCSPADELDELGRQGDAGLGVNDRGPRVADEVRRDDRVSRDPEDAFKVLLLLLLREESELLSLSLVSPSNRPKKKKKKKSNENQKRSLTVHRRPGRRGRLDALHDLVVGRLLHFFF